jgi:hypothetical protein
MSIFTQKIIYKNNSDDKRLLIIQPWCEYYWVEPGDCVEIIGSGGEPGPSFEMQHGNDEVIFYAWVDSIITVMRAGEEVSPDDQN